MGSYREPPSPILLRYPALGIEAAPTTPRIGLQIDDVAALNKPYRFIYRFSSKRRPPAEVVLEKAYGEDLRKKPNSPREKIIYRLKNKLGKHVACGAVRESGAAPATRRATTRLGHSLDAILGLATRRQLA